MHVNHAGADLHVSSCEEGGGGGRFLVVKALPPDTICDEEKCMGRCHLRNHPWIEVVVQLCATVPALKRLP